MPANPERAKHHFDVIKRRGDSPKTLTTTEEVAAERTAFLKAIQDVAAWMKG